MQNKKQGAFIYTKNQERNLYYEFWKSIRRIENGNKIAREGWNGKGMYIFKHEGFDTNEVSNITGNKHDNVPPFICMKTADKNVVFGWLASQTDMLAEDWKIIR